MVLKKVGEIGGAANAEPTPTIAQIGNILGDGRSHGDASSSFRRVLSHLLIMVLRVRSGISCRREAKSPPTPVPQHTHRCKTDHVETKGISCAGNPRYQGQRARTSLLIHLQITHSTFLGQELPSWCSDSRMCQAQLLYQAAGKGAASSPGMVISWLCQGTFSWLRRGSRCHRCPHSCSFPGCGCCLHEQGGAGSQGGCPER